MTVWIIYKETWDGFTVHKVFSSRESAYKCIEDEDETQLYLEECKVES